MYAGTNWLDVRFLKPLIVEISSVFITFLVQEIRKKIYSFYSHFYVIPAVPKEEGEGLTDNEVQEVSVPDGQYENQMIEEASSLLLPLM